VEVRKCAAKGCDAPATHTWALTLTHHRKDLAVIEVQLCGGHTDLARLFS